MTSREIIERVIHFDSPPRIGLALPEPYGNDMFSQSIAPAGGLQPPAHEPQGTEVRRWEDEWGVVWHSLTEYDQGEVVRGAIVDWGQLDDWRPPDLSDPARYAAAAERFGGGADKFRIGALPGFVFNIARKIRKLEAYLCDLILERENVARLHEKIRGQLLAAIARWGEAGADAIMFCEDWGTQDRLMIDPAMWREIFRPEFAALCGAAHEAGLAVFMHSCGKITSIIPDLIETGVDLLQFDQPRLHGIDTLAGFAGRVTFWCPVDIQKTLQTRDPDAIRSEAKELIEKLGARGGGFVAGYYGGNRAIGLTDDVQDHACRAFVDFAKYH